jgi:hypothetical protein
MGNLCSNNVSFHGDKENIENLMKAYEKTLEICKTNQSIHFVLFKPNTRVQQYLSEIQLDWDGENSCIFFTTNWSPDPVQILRAAKMFNVSFIYSYEELSSDDYGEFSYDHTTDELKDRCLTEDEIQECKMCDNMNHPDDCDAQECDDYANNFEAMDKILENKDFVPCTYCLNTGIYTLTDL